MKFNYKKYFKNKSWLWLSISGIILLALSLVVDSYAGKYANGAMSNSVSDIILSNIRVFDVDGIFVYGPMIFWAFVLYLALAKPNRIPFISKSVALFVLTRAVFISLTHIGSFPNHLIITPPHIFGLFSYYGDLFFSGHTGLPFLLALLFWDNKYLRILFILTAIFFGVIVLLGHLHYSIDVLGAFFITYSVYAIAAKMFKKDKALFDSEI
jgi:membrane-associated phospholipid phosphatase